MYENILTKNTNYDIFILLGVEDEMILNVSGRTDIVANYTEWFMNRYNDGYVDVRNPFNHKLVSRINFSNVDLILFCTKNPIPILDRLKEIDKPILFHVTLTPYKSDIEPGVPDKNKIIDAIKRLSFIVGIDNLTVRYDPIFISDKYSVSYHVKAFTRLCELLDGYVNNILISFMDKYKNVLENREILKYRELTFDDYKNIGLSFSEVARKHGIKIFTCSEEHNLVKYGFSEGECLSQKLAFKLTGRVYKEWSARKDKKCHCVEMVDIGSYNTCRHFCKYCYANYDEGQVRKNIQLHDPNSSLLIGHLEEDDIIKERYK